MKIKKLEFSNINSLAGEWTIDFESPAFANKGMFCIAGPTGSGKTSILDAICLGLYGATPRLDAIKGTSNELMTYGAMSCYSKVTFECGGVVYTAHWAQHRAPRTGRLQNYNWMLTNETAGTQVYASSNQSDFKNVIAKVIGLDFDQFTKSMMLAQGEFNKFLKCKEGERAAILEKLTGDSIYRKIAVAVHDLYEAADDAVTNIENKMEGVHLLSEEELAELNAKIDGAKSARDELNASLERWGKICSWYDSSRDIEKRLNEAKNSLTKAEHRRDEFEPKRDRLSRALLAHDVETLFAEFDSVRKALAKMEGELGEKEKKLPEAQSKLEKAAEDSLEKQQALEKLKTEYSENEALWEKVFALDGDIRNAHQKVDETKKSVAGIQNEVKAFKDSIDASEAKIAEFSRLLNEAEDYIAAHQKEESIDTEFALLKTQVTDWKSKNQACAALLKKVDDAKNELQKFDATQLEQNRNLQKVQEYLDAHQADADLVNVLPEMNGCVSDAERHHSESTRLQQEIGEKQKKIEMTAKTLDEIRGNLSTLQMEKETIIQKDIPVVVEELRRNLKPGEACPVCGSLEHRSCEKNVEVANGANSLNDFAAKLRKINAEMEKVQRNLDSLEGNQRRDEEVVRENTQKAEDEAKAEAQSLATLNAKLEPWEKSVTLETARSVLQELLKLKDAYQQNKAQAETLQNEVNQAAVRRATLESAVNTAQTEAEKATAEADELSRKIEIALSIWFSNVRMEDVDALLLQLEGKRADWKKAKDSQAESGKNLELENSAKSQNQKSLDQATQKLNEMEDQQKTQQDEWNRLIAERAKLFGEKSVEAERKKAREQRDSAEKLAETARSEEQKRREEKNALDLSIADLNDRIAKAKPDMSQKQTAFTEGLASKGFASENEFVAARIPEAERKSLQDEQKKVESDLTAAETAVKTYGDQQKALQDKRDFEESEDVAKQNRETSKTKLEELNQNLGTWTQQKKTDDSSRQKFNAMQAELDQLKEKRTDWEQMQHWFNGNRLDTGNGDVFVKFIQTITLRALLKIANGYLHDMFPRYEMIAERDSLNIQLIDHDNSDAVRPIDNISGGEGFLVSLALALGISTLASRNVKIDSMFLDEGFGTLDSKMLQETVLVLQKMQQERGKLLGVITHLDVVKGELGARIDVTPRGGRSVLSGAGVS